MLKNSTYKEKFAMLKAWMPKIVEDIKKDIRNEHLKNDWMFVKKYLNNKNMHKATAEDLAEAYSKAVAEEESAEEIGEFLTNRWLLKHGDIYHYFEQKLTAINPNFSDLEEIDTAKSKEIIDGAVTQFGAPNTYLFAVLNSVVFSKDAYDTLAKKALDVSRKQEEAMKQKHEFDSIAAMQSSYEEQMARLTDKYEKKLAGMQKKYLIDVEALKKQVANLTRKLNG